MIMLYWEHFQLVSMVVKINKSNLYVTVTASNTYRVKLLAKDVIEWQHKIAVQVYVEI